MEYLRTGKDIAGHGIYAELYGYQYHAFIDFREIYDADGSWYRLLERLNGQPVASVEQAYREMLLAPVLDPFKKITDNNALTAFVQNKKNARKEYENNVMGFIDASASFIGTIDYPVTTIKKELCKKLDIIPLQAGIEKLKLTVKERDSIDNLFYPPESIHLDYVVLLKVVIETVEKIGSLTENDTDDLRFEIYSDNHLAYYDTCLVKILLKTKKLPDQKPLFAKLLNRSDIREYLMVNTYEDKEWFNKEQYRRLIAGLYYQHIISKDKVDKKSILTYIKTINELYGFADSADYQFDKLLKSLSPSNL